MIHLQFTFVYLKQDYFVHNVKGFIKPLLIFLMLLVVNTTAQGEPAYYTVTAQELNVRSGPGTRYSTVTQLHKGETIVVQYMYDGDWAAIKVASTTCYISRKYITYKGPVPAQKPIPTQKTSKSHKVKKTAGGFWDFMYEVVKFIILICVIVMIIGGVFEIEWAGYAVLLLIVCGIGAIIGGWFFDNARAGAVIGMFGGIAFFLKNMMIDIDTSQIGWLTLILWYIISLPFYIMNYLQFWLSKPWRPLMKKNTIPDSAKPGMRSFLRVLQIPFYIALFPLRFVNAVYYNIIIHNIYELSNYILEVAIPSDSREGGKDFWEWMAFLPYRIIKYPLGHGLLTLIESLIWTIIDTFIPAITLFHGTAEEFADNMLCDPKRNTHRKYSTGWLTGIWNVGDGNYAGDGIYFGITHKTLLNYEKGSAIVARVSVGKTIDVTLMPNYVYNQAGHRNAKAVSNWGLNNGYVSGEWWRTDECNTDWWEICLYDRQNRYNDSWRIRPIYAIRSRDGLMQRVPGGTAHWLFRDMVWKDLMTSIKKLFK